MALFDEKLARARALLEDLELDAAAFSTQANFAWLTGGRDNHVGLATESGNAVAVVTRERAFIVCDNIEEPRIREEEVGDLGLEVIGYPWWEGGLEDRITQAAGTDNWSADIHIGDRPSIEPFMYSIRSSLLPEEVETYRKLGKLAGLAVQKTADALETGMTEHQAAGILSGELISHGAVPQVVLIAADERIAKYRHPIPTSKRIERCCMLVAGARMNGLICSITRIVHFGKIPDGLARVHRLVCDVDAAFISNTVPGESVGAAMQAGLRAYADAGYPDEWKLHHQGGPTGYRPREFRATPGEDRVIRPFQAFAWNPTITGSKCEDTIIAQEPYPEIVSVTPDWPTVEVSAPSGVFRRPDILIK